MGHRNKKVLIVDSQTTAIGGLKNGLAEVGYEVHHAKDGNAALEFVKHNSPLIILSDVNLPQLDGHRLLKAIRAHENTKMIPFIFISDQKIVDKRISSISVGADDYVIKPYYIDELLARIETLLKEVDEHKAKNADKDHSFGGDLTEMNLVDLVQTLEVGNKSGILTLKRNGREGQVSIRAGQVINAVLDNHKPEQALANMLTWSYGKFCVDLKEINSPKRIALTTKEIVASGLEKLSQLHQLEKQLPSLNSALIITPKITKKDINGLSVGERKIIEIAGKEMSISGLVEASLLDDIQALKTIISLYKKGLLLKSSTPVKPGKPVSQPLKKIRLKNKTLKSNTGSALSIISSFFRISNGAETSSEKIFPDESHYRNSDRLGSDSRKNYVKKKKRQIYLTKYELLMIRECLL